MKHSTTNITCEINLQPGETLKLPDSIIKQIGAGKWIVTIQSKPQETEITRNHQAFLNGYAPEDEGLYDDYSVG